MRIKPWNEELQSYGSVLDGRWTECDDQFSNLFSNSSEGEDYDVSERYSYRGVLRMLALSLYGKTEGVASYFKNAKEILQILSDLSRITNRASFDNEDEARWFIRRLEYLQQNVILIEQEVTYLTYSRRYRQSDNYSLSLFFHFHNRLKELSKYCLLRMDVKRVQSKLVERALNRIDEELWKSIQSSGRNSLIDFLRQSEIRLKNLNNLRDVQCVNHTLGEGIIYADKAYSPQTKKSKGNITLKVVCSLNIDLGDNDIISGHFSLDRNLEGFIATESTVAESPIIIAYKGTDLMNRADRSTDIVQALTCANDVYLMALGLLLYVRDTVGCRRTVRVYGHSLGGGLMQFAVSSAPSGRIYGYGYNSAGLSSGTMRLIPQPMHVDKIRHFRVRNDWVMATGDQIGIIEQYTQPIYNRLTAHFCYKIREVLNQKNVFVNLL